MQGGDNNSSPIQILVNYWELKPSQLGERLNDLVRSGISDICTFVPWQAVESDISHGLARFLLAAHERRITVTLILSPEVGVHYVNSGLPRELLGKPETLAASQDGGSIVSALPPNVFALPSLLAPEFVKRFHHFLGRVDALLADLERQESGLTAQLKLVLTGSYWKYYRSHRVAAERGMGGVSGDHSASAEVTFRNRVEQLFAQKEFSDSRTSWSGRWKSRGFEGANRKWFAQHCEEVFRSRSAQFLGRRCPGIATEQIELYTPEADPSTLYSSFLQLVSGSHADFAELSGLLDEYALRASGVAQELTRPVVHWTGMGGFQTLSDSEKQFLLLKTLLLFGGRGGGFIVDEDEWFSLSPGFRGRATSLARWVAQGELSIRTRALFLSSHLWSGADTLWRLLSQRLGCELQMIADPGLMPRFPDSTLLTVDSQMVLTKDLVLQLLDWARAGRVVVLDQHASFTDAARLALDDALARGPELRLDLGLPYVLHVFGQGRVVRYEMLESRAIAQKDLETFLVSLLALSDVENPCSVSDARVRLVPMTRAEGGIGLFVLNPSGRPVAAELLFASPVEVSDLTLASVERLSAQPTADDRLSPQGSLRFGLEVPPCGILPVAVDSPAQKAKAASTALQLGTQQAAIATLSASFEVPAASEQEVLLRTLGAPRAARHTLEGGMDLEPRI